MYIYFLNYPIFPPNRKIMIVKRGDYDKKLYVLKINIFFFQTVK